MISNQNCIGYGGHGKIYELNNMRVEKIYQNMSIFFTELFVLSLCQEVDHFCQIRDASFKLNNYKIVMDRYNSDLHHLMVTLPNAKRVDLVDSITNQLCEALKYLHSHGIAHNDIHLSNIFCNYDSDNNTVKCYLGDFGLSTIYSSGSVYMYHKTCKDKFKLMESIHKFITYSNNSDQKLNDILSSISLENIKLKIDHVNTTYCKIPSNLPYMENVLINAIIKSQYNFPNYYLEGLEANDLISHFRQCRG